MTLAKDWVQQLREDWARVGKTERGELRACGICGCKSDLWETVGGFSIGIKSKLVCPGQTLEPALHERIAEKQQLLNDDSLPNGVLEDIILELWQLRATIQRSGQDVKKE